MKFLMGYKNYRKLYIAGAVSELGSFVTDTALLLFVYQLTSSKADLGILRAAFLVFLTLGGILGGPLGEKINRKKILIFCEIARIPFVLLLLIFPSFYSILICQSAIAFFTGIFRPSRQALVNEVVPFKDIKAANSLQGSTIALIHLISPVLGATLFTFLNGVEFILFLDLLSYLLGLFLLMKINYEFKSTEKVSHRALIQDLKSGLSYINNRLDIKAIFSNSFIAGLAIGILFPLILPFTIEFLKQTKFEYGILMGSFGLGGFIGGIFSQKLSRYFTQGKLAASTALTEPLIFILWINIFNYPLSALILFFWGVLVFVRITSQLNYISESVPTEQLTKLYSFNEMAFLVPNIFGGILIGIYGEVFNTYDLLLYAGILFIVTTLFRLLFKGIYSLYKGQSTLTDRETILE